MPSILDKIVATKRQQIATAKAATPEHELHAALANAPPARDFRTELDGGGSIKLIAEVKKASPSKGVIRADFRPVEIARTYQQHGATCLSVLTDEPYFQGHLDHLRDIRAAVDLPVLRKDFILDSYQLVQARAAGADAILLIAECLEGGNLRRLHDEAIALGLVPLVELYEPENLPRALQAGATLIGVNNRDLRTFEVDLNHAIRLRGEIPDDCIMVSESGIRTRADVLRLEAAGVHAILVGESLVASSDIGIAVDALLGRDTSAPGVAG